MRNRDIFQLSKRRLRDNAKLRAATPTEKWFWLELCLFLDDQEQRGVTRWPLDRLARYLHCPLDVLRNLVRQEILKGADEDMECLPFIHKDRHGEEHTLIPAQPGPIWFSSAIVRDEFLRQVASHSGRKAGNHFKRNRQAISEHTSTRTPEGAHGGLLSGPPPPALSPPETPSYPPTNPQIPGASAPGASPHAADAGPQPAQAGKGGSKAKGAKGERKLSDEQLAAWREFTDWWKFVLWPKYHEGEVYDFQKVDGVKSLEVLKDPRLHFDLNVVKAMAELYMNDPEIYGNWDHKLTRFHQKRGWYLRLYRRRQQEGTRHVIAPIRPASSKPTAEQRGQFASDINVPITRATGSG